MTLKEKIREVLDKYIDKKYKDWSAIVEAKDQAILAILSAIRSEFPKDEVINSIRRIIREVGDYQFKKEGIRGMDLSTLDNWLQDIKEMEDRLG